ARPSGFVPDHGTLMRLFLIAAGDARAFAHLHPRPEGSSAIPAFVTKLPSLPAGKYHVFGDVVHETGFERTLVGTLTLGGAREQPQRAPAQPTDADDAWYVGDASRSGTMTLADGSSMSLEIAPSGVIR